MPWAHVRVMIEMLKASYQKVNGFDIHGKRNNANTNHHARTGKGSLIETRVSASVFRAPTIRLAEPGTRCSLDSPREFEDRWASDQPPAGLGGCLTINLTPSRNAVDSFRCPKS